MLRSIVLNDANVEAAIKDMHAIAMERLELFARRALSKYHLRGLAPGQWAILRILEAAGGRGRAPGRLAILLQVEQKWVERAVAILSRRGYVTLSREHSRPRLLLTEEGRTKLASDPMHALDGALCRLGPSEKRELSRMMGILLDAQAMDRGHPRESQGPKNPAHLAGPTRPRA